MAGYKKIDPQAGKKTQFKKGQSGNPAGKPRKLPEIEKLMADVLGEEKDGKTAAEAILMALRAKAAKGDIRAAEVLLNRAFGMAKQSIQTDGVIRIVAAQKPDADNRG